MATRIRYYSPSQNGFIEAEDSVVISEELWLSLLGKEIEFDEATQLPRIFDRLTSLPHVIQRKSNEIYNTFASESLMPVVGDSGYSWNGGHDSRMMISIEIETASSLGEETVTLFDNTKTGRVLTIAEATQVCMAVSVKYRSDYAQKKALLKTLESATTIEEVNAIVWV